MKILVTGSEGYLGSLVAPVLMRQGHEVTGLDTGFYRDGLLYHENQDLPRTLIRDIRKLKPDDLRGFDAIAHLAELSNDPIGELQPDITYEINHKGTIRLAEAAKAAGVKRFIYMSSCSVYGVAEGDDVNEESPTNPQTAYAICKTLCERDLQPLVDDNFTACYFRNATAFGASPRQRFDIVLNNLCGIAATTGKIAMISDGSPWRPLVHGLDIAKAIACAVDAPREAVHNEIFNIGSNAQNYQVRDIAEKVGEVFTDCDVTFGEQSADNRSYRVNFDKVRKHLPDFECDWDADKGVRQFHQLFQEIGFDSSQFENRAFTRLKQLQHLIATSQIDDQFFWNVGI